MSKTIDIIVNAVDEASATLKKIQESVKWVWDKAKSASQGVSDFAKKNEKAFKGMAIVWGVSLWAITLAVKNGITSLNQYESVTHRLETLLGNVQGATKEQTKLLIDQANAIDNAGVASKENIITLQAQLATFDLHIDTIEKLTPAINDYVLAEKWATASADDYQSMVNGLAQAMNWNFASLTKTGFVLDDVTKNLISNGTEMERAKAITDVLNSTYEGFNTKLVETQEGLEIMRKKWFQELNENIANVFLPVLKQANEIIAKVTTAVNTFAQANPELFRQIVIVTTALAGLVLWLGVLWLALPTIITTIGVLSKAIAFMTWPIGLVIIALWLFLLAWQNDTLWMRTSMEELGASVYTMQIYTTEQVGIMRGNFTTEMERIGAKVYDSFTFIAKTLNDSWTAIKSGVNSILTPIVSYLQEKLNSILWLVQRIKDAAKAMISFANGGGGWDGVAGARANWWPVTWGSTYLVGERWPELFTPRTSGKITANENLWNNISINFWGVSVRNDNDIKSIAEMVTDSLTRQLQLWKLWIS